ncbi:hypothetical protein C2S52_001340 [Perilla frutescens var. hirtella]|nr:hypothetical protein C2S52_001340 [Perilla frutescens var. hirtella]
MSYAASTFRYSEQPLCKYDHRWSLLQNDQAASAAAPFMSKNAPETASQSVEILGEEDGEEGSDEGGDGEDVLGMTDEAAGGISSLQALEAGLGVFGGGEEDDNWVPEIYDLPAMRSSRGGEASERLMREDEVIERRSSTVALRTKREKIRTHHRRDWDFPRHNSRQKRRSMVHFQDTSISEKHYLVITDDDQQPVKRGTRLRAREPLIGKYASHHQQGDGADFLPFLRRQIVEGKARWHDKVEFLGESRHFDGYWEWTEDVLSRCSEKLHSTGIYDPVYAFLFTYDRNTEVVKAFCEAWCPLMNTLLTSSGELSISLWDLHVTADLPLIGLLCDEMVPRMEELTGVNKRGKLFVPASCKYLFHAYYLLGREDDKASHHSVSIERWTKFWSRRKSRYRPLPLRKEKKSQCPKLMHNPSGEVEDHKEWTSSERVPLTELGVKENHQNKTYLAAHLACWLCSFVLPEGDGSLIRPNVFKIASIMASGEKVSLAVPVLASIYHGLNKISSLAEPPQGHSAFPIHFIYGWMACYLRTHFDLEGKREAPRMVCYLGEGGARFYGPTEARKRVHRAELVSWHCIMPSRAEDFVFIDDENASDLDRGLFMAI